jgi:precorrin-2/cobalt-factor-2 C20-methyltransferase
MSNPSPHALPGHFYAVGVGPGAPDLLTLRAARLIETADLIIMPRSELAGQSLALTVIKDLLHGQETIEHVYPMERDIEKTNASWFSIAELVLGRCARGQAVVQVTIGDPLIYSTSSYLMALLANRLPAGHLHVVPGISAFQAAAGMFAEPLTLQEDRMVLMPATDLDEVERMLGHCETLLLYKVGPRLQALAALLARHGLAGEARLVCHAGQGEREVVLRDLAGPLEESYGYMSTVIVHIGRRAWRPAEPQTEGSVHG